MGFPTANINYPKEIIRLRAGVYSGLVDGHKAVINVGSKPTFNGKKYAVEVHIIGFNGNLYGKKIKIYFTDYIRDIKKFNGASELIEQIREDINFKGKVISNKE